MVIWPALVLVSGLAWLPAVTAQISSSTGSGLRCGTQICAKDATCIANEVCQCDPGTYGDGDFLCFSEGRVSAQVTGSKNALVTLANTSADLVWPCRTRFTEVETFRTSDGSKCHFQVFVINKIIGGRVAAAGMEVHLRVGAGNNGAAFKIEGIAERGFSTVTEGGRDFFDVEPVVYHMDKDFIPGTSDEDGSGSGDSPFNFYSPSMTFIDDTEDDGDDWGPRQQLAIGQGMVVHSKVDVDNFTVVAVSDCGVDIRFRPPDVLPDWQKQTSGIAVSVAESNGPVFPDSETYLAESPTDSSLSSLAMQHSLDTTQEALHRSMSFAAKQQGGRVGRECTETFRTYQSTCKTLSDRLQALASCSFFLSKPDLVQCMETETDGTGYQSLNAFKVCMWNACKPSNGLCNLLKTRVSEKNCIQYTPDSFQQLPCMN